MRVGFEDWTKGRPIAYFGTNTGADVLPFQGWRRFKEAFTPELIARAVAESEIPVRSCLDMFGGSGTTALACQFLGIHPVTIEINPFLADLIEAKLVSYDADRLVRDLAIVLRRSEAAASLTDCFDYLPATFVEPGENGQWIFNRDTFERIAALKIAIESLAEAAHRRLFRVLLGGILVEVSNVVVSGKGRRYRRRWQDRRRPGAEVDRLFAKTAEAAIAEIHAFAPRAKTTYELVRGDCREAISRHSPTDLAVFSPPYPNSFDYTDVYNVELWTLGYLTDAASNQALRRSTLCSHVQISRKFPPAPSGSPLLATAVAGLEAAREKLWSPWIPEMVGGYFADMLSVLKATATRLSTGASAWVVVGNSRYIGIQIDTAAILAELAPKANFEISLVEPFRSMRASAQQGGRRELAETLLVLKRR